MGCGTSVKTEYQGKKSEKAIKAAVLIQRWYRFYMARLEMRRRYTLNIFQSIEYAEEQAQLQLSNFFTFMMDHYAQVNEQHPDPDLISDIVNSSKEGQKKLKAYKTIEVPDSYDGPRMSFPLSVSDTNTLLTAFKQEKQLHARYVLQLFHEIKNFLKQMPNIVHLTTSYAKQITICGDLHGKLDDLLLIFYKNGLPSPENTYLFNGDFVDRGKNSIEILIILFAFLLVYPNNFHLNRGNHEDPIMNLRYGFTKEVLQKYKIHAKNILHLLEDIYSLLPLATIIDSKVLILHGGIADTTDLDFLTTIKRSKYKSALKHPRSDPERNALIHKDNDLPVDDCKVPDNCQSPQIFSSSHPHTGGLPAEFSNGAILEIHYMDSSVQLPDMTPELTVTELKEWKQVVDILWSDPRSQNGCSPNSFRGGGCYFGPDITKKLLDQYDLKMLIRSHECKQEGYELSHNGKVITIFSASNYYDEGSNRGAYLKLCPDLIPHFVQYQVSKSTRKLTLHQRMSAVEDSALRALQEQFFAHHSDLVKAFKECDPDDTGNITVSEWASAMEAVLHLDLPWRTLRSRLARLTPEGSVEYLSCFEDLQIEKPIKEGQPSLVETLYRYKADLEIIFNIIDKDHSDQLLQNYNSQHARQPGMLGVVVLEPQEAFWLGNTDIDSDYSTSSSFLLLYESSGQCHSLIGPPTGLLSMERAGLISIDEFRQTWKLFSSHLHISIDDATIDDLAHSIDSNKDGSIDFNEFLEAFRVVHKFERKDSNKR